MLIKNYKGEESHKRWSMLYNAYDLKFMTDTRKEYRLYCKVKQDNISRIDFMEAIDKIDALFYVGINIFKENAQVLKDEGAMLFGDNLSFEELKDMF